MSAENDVALGVTLDLRALPIVARDDMDAALNLFDEREVQKLDVLAGELMDIMASYPERPPENAAENAKLSGLDVRADKVFKELEALKKARLEPLNAEIAAVRAFCSGLVAPLVEKFDRKVGEATRWLDAYRRAELARVEREREATRKAMEEAAIREGDALARGDLEAAEAASREQMRAEVAAPRPVPKGVKTEDGGRAYIKKWMFEIVDPAQVPRQFCEPDKTAIGLAVNAGVRHIPGVNIYEGEIARRTRG